MKKQYILSVDQSTQGTKALLFDNEGMLIDRADKSHKQIINEQGWISHDLNEIYQNFIQVIKDLVQKTGIKKEDIIGLGISNQRETAGIWDKITGEPVENAIVWQCSRAKNICDDVAKTINKEIIFQKTGIKLSPYFPAAKFAWFLRNSKEAQEKYENNQLMFGTIDTWLLFKLTNKIEYKTDYSNASRTQLFDIKKLQWDKEICRSFGIKTSDLAQVCNSNDIFGKTDLEGYLKNPIPIVSVMGDSHAALFGQGCWTEGMIKTTYGTGSSVMMNIGSKPIFSSKGVVTSLAWGMDGKINYVLEGNINYTGAVISWLKDNLKLISSAKETEELAKKASQYDETYLVPAFSGLGAPYWDSDAKAVFWGMNRNTKREELVKAGLESIAYQIADVIDIMKEEAGIEITDVRVDGGPTRNNYLMQFQSELINIPVKVPQAEELSGIGAAYAAGMKLNLFDKNILKKIKRIDFYPQSDRKIIERKKNKWHEAIKLSMNN